MKFDFMLLYVLIVSLVSYFTGVAMGCRSKKAEKRCQCPPCGSFRAGGLCESVSPSKYYGDEDL